MSPSLTNFLARFSHRKPCYIWYDTCGLLLMGPNVTGSYSEPEEGLLCGIKLQTLVFFWIFYYCIVLLYWQFFKNGWSCTEMREGAVLKFFLAQNYNFKFGIKSFKKPNNKRHSRKWSEVQVPFEIDCSLCRAPLPQSQWSFFLIGFSPRHDDAKTLNVTVVCMCNYPHLFVHYQVQVLVTYWSRPQSPPSQCEVNGCLLRLSHSLPTFRRSQPPYLYIYKLATRMRMQKNFLSLEFCTAIWLCPCAYIEDFNHALTGSGGSAHWGRGGGLGRKCLYIALILYLLVQDTYLIHVCSRVLRLLNYLTKLIRPDLEDKEETVCLRWVIWTCQFCISMLR